MNDWKIDDRTEIVAAFVTESEEMLATMEQALLALEHAPDDADLLHEIFRCAHTIKGSAACLAFDELTQQAHVAEELLDRLRQGEAEVTKDVVSRLLDSVDTMRELAQGAAGAGPQAWEETGGLKPAATQSASLRVSIPKLDRMLDLTGEIAVARGHVRELVAREDAYGTIFDAVRELDRLSADLQELVMSARLVPLGPALRPFQRVVRDVAASQQKRAALVIDAGDVEVDTTVIEHLKDPITHMLRNALDHGIETPQARIACGKPPAGTIRIAAAHENGGIAIRISDDGKGLDEASIGPDLNVIFRPGFTTATEVTDISGRGVGMDVVRRNVEALRGTISVASKPGAGMTVTIRLPLTLTVIQGFAVGVSGETYVVPIETVVECLTLPDDASPDACGVLNVRGAALPFVRLRDLFDLVEGGRASRPHLPGILPGSGAPDGTSGAGGRDARPPKVRQNVVIVQHDEGCAGLVVDELLGATETVMKPLGGLLGQVPGVAGSSILGNGRVALVLDAREVVRRAEAESHLTHRQE